MQAPHLCKKRTSKCRNFSSLVWQHMSRVKVQRDNTAKVRNDNKIWLQFLFWFLIFCFRHVLVLTAAHMSSNMKMISDLLSWSALSSQGPAVLKTLSTFRKCLIYNILFVFTNLLSFALCLLMGKKCIWLNGYFVYLLSLRGDFFLLCCSNLCVWKKKKVMVNGSELFAKNPFLYKAFVF